jgi:signal transduction histidine kinase
MPLQKTHVPLIRTFTIIITILFTAAVIIGTLEKQGDTPFPLDASRWQWAPASSWDAQTPSPHEWRPYTEPVPLTHPYFWLRIPLPEHNWMNPVLFMLRSNDNRVYVHGQPVYEGGWENHGIRINTSFYWHMIPLPTQLPQEVIVLMRNGTVGPLSPSIEIGAQSTFIDRLLHRGIDNLVLGSLLVFGALISVGLFATNRDRLYWHFALLMFSGGCAALVGNELFQLLWNNPWISSLQETAMPWATFAVVGILGQLYPDFNRRAVKTLYWIVLSFSVLATLGAFASMKFYMIWTAYLYSPVFLCMLIVAYWTIWKAYREQKDTESIWVMAGFSSLVAVAFVHVIRYWLPPGIYMQFPELKTYLGTLPTDFIYLGLLAFIVCLIRVMIYRYTAMNRQLAEVNRSLEKMVDSRIVAILDNNRQLSEANEQLAASQRELAEALAESIIIEERHRITGAIHETVGHTLTTSIDKLEEARKLLLEEQAAAAEVLMHDAQELARKGLEDIRQSVRLLREDTTHYDLHGSIGALMNETENSANIRIERRLGDLPDTLTVLQKRIIFQALQEGLAFGIKQCQSRHFEFWLFHDEGTVRLRLLGDVHSVPEEEISFGLRILAERVAQIGGQLRLNLSPSGMSLSLSLQAPSP